MRIAVVGAVALAIFSVMFFRLWFLQVLSGDEYLLRANDNRVREVRVEAPRGDIVDRKGRLLVGNRPSWVVQVDPQRWPEGPARTALYRRLSGLLEMSEAKLRQRTRRQFANLPFRNATIAENVSYRDVVALLERQDSLPGVVVSRVFKRSYPRGEVGAHLFGYVREISPEQIKGGRFEGAEQGDSVGQDGLELRYDQYLRGVSGLINIQVDSMGRAKGRQREARQSQLGKQLRLSIDLDLQTAGEAALRTAAGLARSNGNPGRAGAFVAMDVRSGEVLALSSAPTFDPAIFTRPFSQAAANRLFSDRSGAPYTDRAISSAYPAGSTFKLVTAIAALESGIYTPSTVINDTGKIKIADRYFTNAGEQPNGPVALRRALAVSSDIYFYEFGRRANLRGGDLIQRWAARYGFGSRTGIDLPNEASGVVPSAKVRARQKPYRWRGQLVKPQPWYVGDTVNLSVGQGELQVTPLQMAVAYAAVANGGYLVRPHLALRVETAIGQAEQEIEVGARRKVPGSERYRRAVLDGLRAAAKESGGTSADVFADFPVPVAGKTGTAQTPSGDQSWYVALAPYPNPRYVVAVTIEQGGFGAEAAAPAAKLILANLFNVRAKKVAPGASRTR